MARKSYTGLDQFKKYRNNRKKAETFRKRIHGKAVRDLRKLSRQKDLARKKRMASYKNKHSAVSSEQESQRKGCTLFTVIGIIALITLFFTYRSLRHIDYRFVGYIRPHYLHC